MADTSPHRSAARRRRRKPSPYYTELDTGRREYAAAQRLVGWFGTHLVCPLKACGRAGRCTDDDRAALPFCFDHHRGMIRFLLQLAMAHGPVASAEDEAGAEPREMAPHRGPSFLELFARSEAHLDLFRRPLEAGPCGWTWECEPDAVAFLERYRAEQAGR